MNLLPVDYIENIDAKTFQHQYLKPLKPLVIGSLASSWPALQRWTPEFFSENYGDKQVPVYDASFVKPGKQYMADAKKMPLSDYIREVLSSSQDLRMFLYNIKSQIPELLDDIRFPDVASGFSKQFVFMFFGCKHSVTQMHFDIDMSHVFHTALHGSKTFTLFPYQQSDNLHRVPFTCRSYVDIATPDYGRYPRLAQAQGYEVTLKRGDTLFIPSGYWHHVVYDEAGYGLSLRCSSRSFKNTLHGAYNLLIMQSVDRLMNKCFHESWFEWKTRQSLS